MVVNILFGYILSRMTPLGAAGIPLGYSIGVIVGTSWLLLRLKKEILFFGGGLMPTTVQSILGSAVMSAAVIAVHRLLAGMLTSGSIFDRALLVFVPMVAGMIVYFALTWLMKAQPIRAFLDPILKRGGNA
mgnify:FL=1